ncbi:MAG: hypothetical protein WCO86_09220 [Planctomycetota bacterium]
MLDHLRDPMRLRMFIAMIALIGAYAAIYMPLEANISEITRDLNAEKKRLALAVDIERLRQEEQRFEDRLPREADRNEWVEYVLSGIRKLPLKLVLFDAKGAQEIGPFKVIVLSCELEGGFHDMDRLVRWLEYNDRLFRIDSIKIAQHRSNNGMLVMQLTILGLMG